MALCTLTLDHNALTGAVPSQIGLLSALETFHLASNSFAGALPEGLGALFDHVVSFDVSDNPLVVGPIPGSVEALACRLMDQVNGSAQCLLNGDGFAASDCAANPCAVKECSACAA